MKKFIFNLILIEFYLDTFDRVLNKIYIRYMYSVRFWVLTGCASLARSVPLTTLELDTPRCLMSCDT